MVRRSARLRVVLVTLAVVASGGWLYARPPVVAAGTTPFTDIAGTTFEADIEWLFAEGITRGCAGTLYCPDEPVTRGQMASFLVRMFDLTEGGDIDAFTDDDGTTHEIEINKLAHAGVTKGCTATTFCPKRNVRRDEMASFLARAIPLTAGAGRNYFRDDDGTTHEGNIDRLAAAGIASGCAVWKYCPTVGVTRGQMAGFLHRVVKPISPPSYPAPTGPQTLHVAIGGADAANLCRVKEDPCATIAHALALTLDGDTVAIGPGTYLEQGLVPMADVTITGDTGGGTIIDSGWDGTGIRGFTIAQGHTVRLEHLTLTNSQDPYGRYTWGGGITNHGNLTIASTEISGTSGFETAAIWSDGNLTIMDSTISGNFEGGSGINAAGIRNLGALTLDGSTVNGNDAYQGSGGILNSGSATIANSTISGNQVDYGCGGIYNETEGTLTIINATIALNGAREIPCNMGNQGTLELMNSIVSQLGGPITSKLASIVGIPAGMTLADILDPAGLADNGGPTQTIALTDSATNPALDKGDAATCAAAPVNGLDQRGLPRTPPCDIGAYELQP